MSTELNAGPDLDRLIAEKVMGWRLMDPDLQDLWVTPSGRKRSTRRHMISPTFLPSIDIAHAWEVVDKLGLSVTFWPARSGGIDRFWAAGGYPFEKDRLALEATAPTAPLAICRAALKAMAAS